MVTNLAPAKSPTYVKVANFPCLYRHSRSGLYYACKKLHGVRRERSLQTCDRKIAERRLKEWIGNMDKVDAEVEKTTLDLAASTVRAGQMAKIVLFHGLNAVRPRGVARVK